MDNTAKVQHVTKASSDELLRKFAELGSDSDHRTTAKKELLRLAKRRKRSSTTGAVGHCDSPINGGNALTERKSLLPPATRRSTALIRKLGIGRAKIRTRDLKNKSILGAIGKTWRTTVENASRVFMEKHYNSHRRLINDNNIV